MLVHAETTTRLKKPRIFIVEDEGLIAQDLEIRVRMAGFDVAETADSGEEALEKISENSPDLVLMDIRLSGKMDGIETAREIQKRRDVPIVYLTAHTDRETLDRAKSTGPFGYLAKPVSQKALPTCIEMALYKHGLDRELRQERAWFRTTLRTMADAVIVTDNDGRIHYLNPAAERLTGWPLDLGLENSLAQVLNLIHPQHGSWSNKLLPAFDTDKKPRSFPAGLKLVTRTADEVPVEGEVSPTTEEGTSLGAVITFREGHLRGGPE